MKKQNGFIATSLLYTFFLAFITLFIGVVTLHLQNRVYLNKLEDSSKNALYLREIGTFLKDNGSITVYVKKTTETAFAEYSFTTKDENVLKNASTSLNAANCEIIYFDGSNYYLEECS